MADNSTKISESLGFDLLSGTPSGVQEGDIWREATGLKTYKDGFVQDLGAGTGTSSGINYVDNPDFELSTTGWSTYADAAGVTPIDGTGGIPTTTFTRSTISPLRETASGLITKDAANRQGEGVSYDFTIDSADTSKEIEISFDLETSGVTLGEASDVQIFIYDVTNTAIITPRTKYIATSKGQFKTTFSTTDSTSYRLILHIATTNTSAWTMKIDNVRVGPVTSIFAPNVQDLQSWTPTGTWVTNTTYSGFYRQVGDMAEGWVNIALAGAPTAATLDINLPFTVDTTKVATAAADPASIVGHIAINDASGADLVGIVRLQTSTSIRLLYLDVSAQQQAITATTPITFASGDMIGLYFKVPIVNASSNISVGTAQTFRMGPILANGTIVTAAPTKLGEYRAKYKAASSNDYSTWTDTTPTVGPSADNGLLLYADTYSAVGTAGEVNAYEVFVGKNKFITTRVFANTGLAGSLEHDYNVSGTQAVGISKPYDPVTGIITISAGTHPSSVTGTAYVGRNVSDGTVPTSGYIEIYVSENVQQIGFEPQQNIEALLDTTDGFGSTNTTVRNFSNATNTGNITAAVDATNGASITINEGGIYSISCNGDFRTSNPASAAITLNSSILNAAPAIADCIAVGGYSGAVTNSINASVTLRLNTGDVLRWQSPGNHITAGAVNAAANTQVRFRVVKIAH